MTKKQDHNGDDRVSLRERLDRDADGELTWDDVPRWMRWAVRPVVRHLIDLADTDDSGRVDPDELARLVLQLVSLVAESDPRVRR